MIKRNYFFSAKVLKDNSDNSGYRTIYYHSTRKSWLDESEQALNYLIEKAKDSAAEHGYYGPVVIRAFNRC